MAFYVYILRCNDTSYYTGHTDNLEKRLAQHHTRAFPDCYTANRLPVELVYQQAFGTREEALASERRIKGWSRKKKEAMMSGDWKEVSRLASAKSHTTNGSPDPVAAPPAHPAPVHPEPHDPVHPEPHDPVHPEPVEGCKHSPINNPCANHPLTPLRVNGDSTPEPHSSIHPERQISAHPEPVEGCKLHTNPNPPCQSPFDSAQDERTKGERRKNI